MATMLDDGRARHATLLGRQLAAAIAWHVAAWRGLALGAWPPFDLALRLWLAQLSFVSGVLKIGAWDTALYLAAHEYPVPWLAPVTAAYAAVAIEVVASLFLACGCATRYAAAALLGLGVVSQIYYQAFDSQLLLCGLLGWYALHGAAGLSLDALLREGLAASPVPLVPALLRASAWCRARLAPLYRDGWRTWLGLALLAGAVGQDAQAWLPSGTFAALPPGLAGAFGAMLVIGVGTRYLALGLALTSLAGVMLADGSAGLPLLATLALLAMQGSGPLALERALGRPLAAHFPALAGRPSFDLARAPRVVIVGAGFGGLACARALAGAPVAVTLIDRANYHLFQPLLYQVATAAISPADIAAPVRPLFREAANVRVLLGEVRAIDTVARTVTAGAVHVPFDYLVLATGATHGYFGRDDWQAHAPGLKRIEDATAIRRRLLLAFERAEAAVDPAERAALLSFVIVGGGPTGVELAGAIAELARHGLAQDFRAFDAAAARVVLVQSGPRLLPAFAPSLSERAHAALRALGVEVRLDSRVEDIDAAGVRVNGERIAARTVLWAAGVRASPAAQWLGVPADQAGRLEVAPDLSVPGRAGVFAIGDTALARAWNGLPVPGLAPAAKQAGRYVGALIAASVAARPAPPPFRYRHLGSLATIGRQAAVADFGRLRLWGAPAWWLWGLVHLGFLVGVRNRLATLLNWAWTYLTLRSAVRLITD